MRKFAGRQASRLDPDGNPDTSFLAKIPADMAFTFQTLDKNGMVLNMAQTWHQVRPGEIRNDCGGCHAHSQKPTDFKLTAAAKPDYDVFDLTQKTPLLDHEGEGRDRARSGTRRTRPGCATTRGVKNVEYFRDVKPILDRSCVACHTGKSAKPAGEPRPRRRQDGEPAGLRRRAGHVLPARDGQRRAVRPQAASSAAWRSRTRRGTSACSSRAAACSSGRSSASGSTAGRTTTSRPRRRRATRGR